MISLATAACAFIIIFATAAVCSRIRHRIPVQHLDADSKEVLKLVLGVVATMSALVLGLLVASAKTSYDTHRSELFEITAKLVEVDRLLAHYGPGASESRLLLRQAATAELERVERMLGGGPAVMLPGAARGRVDAFYDSVQQLTPETNAQRFAQSMALQFSGRIAETRILMAQQLSSPIPLPFLSVLVIWLAVLFGGFGLFAPSNATVIAGLLLGSLSVASALFLILELARPHDGIMRISHDPLRIALSRLGQ